MMARPDWVSAIIRDVAAKHGIAPLDLVGPSRLAPLVVARNEAVYRLMAERGRRRVSLTLVCNWVGRKAHQTILHALMRHSAKHGLPPLTTATHDRGAQARAYWRQHHAAKEAVLHA